MTPKYNKYSNIETEIAALYIYNDEACKWHAFAKDLYATIKGDCFLTLGKAMENYYEPNHIDDGLAGSLLSSAISRINWAEIAKEILDVVTDEAKEEAVNA